MEILTYRIPARTDSIPDGIIPVP